MAKLAEKPVTLNHLAKLVESGFADVRSELSKKADKTDLVGLQTDIANLHVELQTDISHLAKAAKLGFDEVHRVLDTKASKTDLRQSEDRVKQRLSHLDNRLDTFVGFEKRLVLVEKEVGFAV